MSSPSPRTLRQFAGLTAPTRIDATTTALVLIDFQREYFDGALSLADGEAAAARAAALVAWTKARGMRVIHVHHVSPHPASTLFRAGTTGVEPHAALEPLPHDDVIVKTLPSSFAGTSLAQTLEPRGIRTLLLAGLMTHMCVDATARDAAQRGYGVIVVADACATRTLPAADDGDALAPATIHRAILAALQDRFADVCTVAEIQTMA